MCWQLNESQDLKKEEKGKREKEEKTGEEVKSLGNRNEKVNRVNESISSRDALKDRGRVR